MRISEFAARNIKRCVCVTAVLVNASIAANPLIYGNVAGWDVWTDPSANYRCLAEASYEGGTLITTGYDADDSLYLVVNDASWRDAAPGKSYRVEVKFDDGEPQRFSGEGLPDRRGILFRISSSAYRSFHDAFVQGHSMTVTPAGLESVLLSLGGSYRAMQLLRDCQSTMAQFR